MAAKAKEADVQTTPEADVQTTPEAELDIDKALATKERKANGTDGKLRMYLVLDGANAKVVKLALAKAGVNGNFAGFLKIAVLNELKRRLAEVGK